LLEKSPPNALRSRWLQEYFRPSRFIAIFRHPYAVCEGIRRRDGHSIEDAARHWTRTYQQLLDDVNHLRYCLCITYEELCAEPWAHLHLMEQFLGLDVPFDRKIIEAPRRIHNIDGAQQTIHNFNRRSLLQLSIGDIATIDRIAGPVMEQLGYQSLDIGDIEQTLCEVNRSGLPGSRPAGPSGATRRRRYAFPSCAAVASRWLELECAGT
jgi:hypothetical protein